MIKHCIPGMLLSLDDKRARLYAVWCVNRIRHLLIYPTSVKVVEMAEKYANGMVSYDEMRSAALDASHEAHKRYTPGTALVFFNAALAATFTAQENAAHAARAASGRALWAEIWESHFRWMEMDVSREKRRAAMDEETQAITIAQETELIRVYRQAQTSVWIGKVSTSKKE